MFEGLVVSCDVSYEALPSLVAETSKVEGVAAYKVGSLLALQVGLPLVRREVVRAAQDSYRLRIIYDHQKAGTDIPQMAEPLLDVCVRSGVHSTIIFPMAGPETLRHWCRAWRQMTREHVHDLIVGAAMTHPEFMVSENGFIADEMPDRVFRDALKYGIRSFVLPATKLYYAERLLRAYLTVECPGFEGEPINVYTPGLGRQQADVDVAKVTFGGRPEFAWYPIIGSAIYKAEDTKAATAEWVDKLR